VTYFFEDFDNDLHERNVLEQPARLREESNPGGAGLHNGSKDDQRDDPMITAIREGDGD
jgi:hypothetical protein